MTSQHYSDKDLYSNLKSGDLESFDAIFDRLGIARLPGHSCNISD